MFADCNEVFVSCVRRSLAYPLYRNWELASTVLNDTKRIFANGRRSVVKSLVAVKHLFDKSDVRRHLSVLYIDDFLVWLQHLRCDTPACTWRANTHAVRASMPACACKCTLRL